MKEEDIKFIREAVEIIQKGVTSKLVSPNKLIQVYRCGNVIRIDIKGV